MYWRTSSSARGRVRGRHPPPLRRAGCRPRSRPPPRWRGQLWRTARVGVNGTIAALMVPNPSRHRPENRGKVAVFQGFGGRRRPVSLGPWAGELSQDASPPAPAVRSEPREPGAQSHDPGASVAPSWGRFCRSPWRDPAQSHEPETVTSAYQTGSNCGNWAFAAGCA
jgi:hypothetical protein